MTAYSLDRRAGGADDCDVNHGSPLWVQARASISTLVVLTLLSFGSMCAIHGGSTCASPSSTSVDEHCVPGHDADGDCGDHDGCGQDGHGDCSHASMCCSTWFP